MPTTRQSPAQPVDLTTLLRISEEDRSRSHGCRLLDVRARPRKFLAGAAWMPVAATEPRVGELPSHMLPPPGSALVVLGDDPAQAQACAQQLRERGWAADWLEQAPPENVFEADRALGALWKPDAFVAEQFDRLRPDLVGDRVVDLGCGNGRDAVYFAQHGMQTLGVDRLPDALAMARMRATHHQVELDLLCADLLRMAAPLAPSFDLAVCARFTGLELLSHMDGWLRVGGLLIFHGYGLHPSKPHPKTMRRAIRLSPERAEASFPASHWEFVEPLELLERDRECWIRFVVRRTA